MRIFLVCLPIFLINLRGHCQEPTLPVKRALVIAIGGYKVDQTGWRGTSSANDAKLLEPVLKKQKFDVEIISDPNKEQIEAALEALRLKSQPGDIILVHISSHGVQITDDNGDEPDGFDESIVPIDAPDASKIPPGYKGEKHLRDDRLGELLTSIRIRLGPKGDLLVLIDACNSGTGTRGPGGPSRGSVEPLRLPGFPSKGNLSEDQDSFFELPKGPELSDVTVISAAQANHLNYENAAKNCGSLTSAFCAILDEVGAEMPYQALFERTQSKIGMIRTCELTGQQPELESTRPGRTMFGGPIAETRQKFPILSIDPAKQTAIINGGKLKGIDAGASLKLYKSGENPTSSKALDSAIVISANELQALVKFARKIPITKINGGFFYLDRRVFRDDTLFVNIDLLPMSMQAVFDKVLARVKYPVALRKVGFDVSIKQVEEGNKTSIGFYMPLTGHLFPTISTDPDFLVTTIETLYWNKTLQYIKLRQEDISINWSMERKAASSSDTVTYMQILNDTLHARQADTGYYLRVQNASNLPIWFNILDFQPDGIFRLHWPQAGTQEEGFRLEPGESRKIPFGLAPPFGKEVFKLFATTSMLDMRSLIEDVTAEGSRGPTSNDTPLTRFLKSRASTRGSIYPTDVKEGKTTEIHYVITP
jgi:hypothetical protein